MYVFIRRLPADVRCSHPSSSQATLVVGVLSLVLPTSQVVQRSQSRCLRVSHISNRSLKAVFVLLQLSAVMG